MTVLKSNCESNMSMLHKPLSRWVAPTIVLLGVPFTYAGMFYSNIGMNLAHGQREILEEESGKLTMLIWAIMVAGVYVVRLLTITRCGVRSAREKPKP
jgi:hypothetical protein